MGRGGSLCRSLPAAQDTIQGYAPQWEQLLQKGSNIQSLLVLKYRGLRVLVNRDDYEPETELGGCKGKTPKLDPF